MSEGYEYQAIDHGASIRRETSGDQITITITRGEDESSITIWREDLDHLADLAAHDREVKAEAWDEAVEAMVWATDHVAVTNPYRVESQETP